MSLQENPVGAMGKLANGGVGELAKASLPAAGVFGMLSPEVVTASLAPEMATAAVTIAGAKVAVDVGELVATISLGIAGVGLNIAGMALTAGGILWGILGAKKRKEERIYYKVMKEAG